MIGLKTVSQFCFVLVVINRSNYYFGIGFRQPFENCTISRCTMFSTHVTESLFLIFDVFRFLMNLMIFFLRAIFNGLKEIFITGLQWATQS